MDITKLLQEVVDALQADKSLVQPWRNYAISDARRLQALVKMGQTQTNLTPPKSICICQADMPKRRDCPVHGTN